MILCGNSRTQESVPVGCQPPACQPYVLHDEQLWIYLGEVEGGPCTARSKFNKSEHVWGDPVQWCTSWTNWNQFISREREPGLGLWAVTVHGCFHYDEINASLVTVTCPPPRSEQIERQTLLKTLHSRNFFLRPLTITGRVQVDAHFVVRDFLSTFNMLVSQLRISLRQCQHEKKVRFYTTNPLDYVLGFQTQQNLLKIFHVSGGKVFLYVTFALMETVTLERNQCSLSDYNSIRYAPYIHLWHRITLTLL